MIREVKLYAASIALSALLPFHRVCAQQSFPITDLEVFPKVIIRSSKTENDRPIEMTFRLQPQHLAKVKYFHVQLKASKQEKDLLSKKITVDSTEGKYILTGKNLRTVYRNGMVNIKIDVPASDWNIMNQLSVYYVDKYGKMSNQLNHRFITSRSK